MKLLYYPSASDHGGYRPWNMGHELVIDFANHRNPHRAAAACKLVIRIIHNVLVKFQRFLQSEDIGEKSYLNHAAESQSLKSAAQFSWCNRIAELP